MSTYRTSTDYDALWDHLNDGGEAIAKVSYGKRNGAAYLKVGASVWALPFYMNIDDSSREGFRRSCESLNLEWFQFMHE